MDSFAKLYEITPETKITHAAIVMDTIQGVSFSDKYDDRYCMINPPFPSHLTKCCERIILRPNEHLNGKWGIVYENADLSFYCDVFYEIPIEKVGSFIRVVISGNNLGGESVSQSEREEKINEVCIVSNTVKLSFREKIAMAAYGRLVLCIDIPENIHIVFPPHPVKKTSRCVVM